MQTFRHIDCIKPRTHIAGHNHNFRLSESIFKTNKGGLCSSDSEPQQGISHANTII